MLELKGRLVFLLDHNKKVNINKNSQAKSESARKRMLL